MWSEIRKKFPVLYFDATGGILRHNFHSRQKPPLLFSLVS